MTTRTRQCLAVATVVALTGCATTRQPMPAPEPVASTPAGGGLAGNGRVQWQCELGQSLQTSGDWQRDGLLALTWKNRVYTLPRQPAAAGAHRFYDAQSGLDLLVIPGKAMLLSRKSGGRLADACKTAGMAPAQADAAPLLR